ncbi:hypothetical protein [Marinomonas posidonica]|uniref:DUF7482 domain-containing protein n=1 Tax=Marinomonas posidonica TaxID=936476 RepID=UPI003734C54B
MLSRSVLLILFTLWLAGCASTQNNMARLPIFQAWHDGEQVAYITTDVSDRKMAKEMQANYAPRLRDAIPRYPKPPQVKTVLERVYGFPNKEQQNIFASAPVPLGYLSRDRHYSPLWLMYWVVWNNPKDVYELTSEEAVFEAEESGLIRIERSDIVVNCPVLPFLPE